MEKLFFDELVKYKSFENFIKQFEKNITKTNTFFTTSLNGSSKAALIAKLFKKYNQILILLPTRELVNELYVELTVLGQDKHLIQIDEINIESIQEKLTKINNNKKSIILSFYDLLKVKLPSNEEISKNTTRIEVGSDLTYDDIIEYLHELNYENEKFVVEQGAFSVRGSIIDFWSYGEEHPCRLEFDGDFLESIRFFDPESQRSSGRVESVSMASSIKDDVDDYSSDIFEYLSTPIIFASSYELKKLTLTEHVENIITEEDDLEEELKEELLETKNEKKETLKKSFDVKEKISYDELIAKDANWIIEDQLGNSKNKYFADILAAPAINSNFKILFNTLSEFAKKNTKIIFTTENSIQLKRLYDLLVNYNKELNELLETGKVKIKILPVKEGFYLKSENILILTDYQVFNKPYRTKISKRQKIKKSHVKEFSSLKVGDFIVHENFGIGKYAGLENIKIGMVEQETIKILFADDGIVYLNINYLSLIKKYSSGDKAPPRLTKLGSNEWKNTKKKVKAKIKDAARDLIKLYSQRKAAAGFAFSSDSVWQRELEASFLYVPTPDQAKVTDEVKADMEQEFPMDRLVCGDVGFGKTEVAIRAAFKSVDGGKQVGVLVPTTILAEQHYNTFKERLSQFPVKVEVLSRFVTQSKQKEIVKDLSEGKVDIVIGTHRLLSKDIEFKDLGLLIIDEEHRFGVMAKEKLRRIRVNVDTLTLTATPIPRTLNLSLLGARDLSIISTPPLNRQPIYTKVETFEIGKIKEWILDEVKRNGQVYFVHDRVQSIEKIAAYLHRHIPQIKILVAHGQMKPAQLEKVIYSFMNKDADVLISTKIIESGLDIPNVNTIIINRADRFGLAELHQLRGRVGRSNRQAYSYFLVPALDMITKKAVKRLQAIEESTELGGGFNLAMRDLEIRGAGNLLGTEQSGSIDTVGFEMYVKLLDEAVEELKINEFKDVFKDLPKHHARTEPTIDTYFEVGIPKSFMFDQSDRLSFYQALFSMNKITELNDIKDEMIDKFGKLPVIINRLISVAIIRYYASFAQLERIVITRKKISILLPKAENEEFYKTKFSKLMEMIIADYSDKIRFVQKNDVMKLEEKNEYDSPEKVMNNIIAFIKKLLLVLNIEC
ncbi:MAG: transcription-repair coupling factor [Ignavibacteriae bacterium]|nr:MAG: transcription-repair coupling factor [Ignavibacteriota bacterium]